LLVKSVENSVKDFKNFLATLESISEYLFGLLAYLTNIAPSLVVKLYYFIGHSYSFVVPTMND